MEKTWQGVIYYILFPIALLLTNDRECSRVKAGKFLAEPTAEEEAEKDEGFLLLHYK